MAFPSLSIRGQTFLLHPLKAVYWEEKAVVFIADLHLGKATYFRKKGIPVPQGVSDANWDKLISILLDFRPKRMLILGDLFHSIHNEEWEEFSQLVQRFPNTSFELVLGNHDILDLENYRQAQLQLHEEGLLMDPFILTHHPLETSVDSYYNLCGHIHPCVRLSGTGRQGVRLACFYFGNWQAILPAFGEFTGMANIRVQKGERVFVIAENTVIEV